MAAIPSNPNDRKVIFDAMKEISNSMTRIDAERDLIRQTINDVCDTQKLSKKTFRRMAKVYHKQNFKQEIAEQEEFETLYETVTNTTTMEKKYA